MRRQWLSTSLWWQTTSQNTSHCRAVRPWKTPVTAGWVAEFPRTDSRPARVPLDDGHVFGSTEIAVRCSPHCLAPHEGTSVSESPGQGGATPSVPKAVGRPGPVADPWFRLLMACPVSFASSGHNGHVPGAGCQHIPAGVPGCGQGQGQRRDDDLLPQRRAPPQLAAASSHASSLAPDREPASLWAGPAGGSRAPAQVAGGEISHADSGSSFCLCEWAADSVPGPGCQRPASTELTKDDSLCGRLR